MGLFDKRIPGTNLYYDRQGNIYKKTFFGKKYIGQNHAELKKQTELLKKIAKNQNPATKKSKKPTWLDEPMP